MGVFSVTLEVADPTGRNFETVEAMVDSGATYTVLPASTLHRLGVEPFSTRRFVLADGSHVTRGFGNTWMRLNDREAVSPVVFWDEDARPLLGTVTLEILSLGIDPVNQRLVPVDAFMLECEVGEGLPLPAQAREAVTSDASVLSGVPCIKGTRILVHDIAAMLANGDSAEAIREAFPQLSKRQLELAAFFARAYPQRGRLRRAQFWRGRRPVVLAEAVLDDLITSL